MSRETLLFTRRHKLLTTFAAVAFLGAFGVAQAQSSPSGTSPTQVNPSSSDTNRDASQGITPGTDRSTSGTMRNDRSTSGSTAQSGSSSMGTTRSGSSMSAQGGATGSPTQVNPSAQDSNRAASQGMVPGPDQSTTSSRMSARDSDLRNDRTTMARAPRADRN